MPRVFFTETVTTATGLNNALIPVSGVAATVYTINSDQSEGAQGTAYAGRTGSTAGVLVSDANGRISFWLDQGDYNIHIDDQQSPPRITSYLVGFSAANIGISDVKAISGDDGDLPSPGLYPRIWLSEDNGRVLFDRSSSWADFLQIEAGLDSALPSPTVHDRFWFSTDKNRIYFDSGAAMLKFLWQGSGESPLKVLGASSTLVPGTVSLINAGVTANLPTPTPDTIIAVQANAGVTGANPAKVSGTMFGEGVPDGVHTIPLGIEGATIWFQAESTTRWRIIAGRVNSGWLDIAPGTGIAVAEYVVTNPVTFLAGARWVQDRVEMSGILVATSTQTAGTTFATLPAGVPNPTKQVNMGSFKNNDNVGPDVTLNTSGQFVINSAGGSVISGYYLELDAKGYSLTGPA